jgi:hypothetical protein
MKKYGRRSEVFLNNTTAPVARLYVHCTDPFGELFVGRGEHTGQTKVNQFDFRVDRIVDKEYVLILEVPVEDVATVHVRDGAQDATGNTSGLFFRVRIARVQIPTAAQLHDDEYLLPMLKCFNGLDNVGWTRV